jgi:hypothetical protein
LVILEVNYLPQTVILLISASHVGIFIYLRGVTGSSGEKSGMLHLSALHSTACTKESCANQNATCAKLGKMILIWSHQLLGCLAFLFIHQLQLYIYTVSSMPLFHFNNFLTYLSSSLSPFHSLSSLSVITFLCEFLLSQQKKVYFYGPIY